MDAGGEEWQTQAAARPITHHHQDRQPRRDERSLLRELSEVVAQGGAVLTPRRIFCRALLPLSLLGGLGGLPVCLSCLGMAFRARGRSFLRGDRFPSAFELPMGMACDFPVGRGETPSQSSAAM